MANSLLEKKLVSFHLKPTNKSVGIMLPQAFLTRTVEAIGLIPANVDVLVERDFVGNFELTWYDERDRTINQKIPKDSNVIDISDIYDKARTELLGAVPLDDLYAEIERRRKEGAVDVKG